MSLTILLVEPEEKLRERVRETLRQDGYRVWAFARADGATEAVTQNDVEPSLALLTAGDDPGIDRLIEVLKGMDYDMGKVLMDHNVEDTTPMSLKAGCWAGHTVYPISKLSPERMANILQDNGYEKMMINSAADWGPSDPLMVTHCITELRGRGVKEKEIEKVVWDNPWNFFSKSGRLK